MPHYTINPRKSRHLDAPVASITAAAGRVSVVQEEGRVGPVTLETNETVDCQGRAGVTISAIGGGAAIHVVYLDEVENQHDRSRTSRRRRSGSDQATKAEPEAKAKAKAKKSGGGKSKAKAATRGDTGGGDTGGFESRTVEQLQAEAAKRKIPGRSSMNKKQLIAALRG